MNKNRKLSQNNSFVKASLLVLGLLLVVILYRNIPDIIKGIDLVMRDDPKSESGSLFSEEERDSLQKVIAGFWVYDDTVSENENRRFIKDRIEIRDNGIVWRVKRSLYRLPLGDTTIITEILQAYLQPFSWVDPGSGVFNCNMQGINKVRIVDGDTCYLPTAKTIEKKERVGPDEFTYLHTINKTWSVKHKDDRFYFEERAYKSYGDRDLSLFFPEKSIELVNNINLNECPSGTDHRTILKEKIKNDLKGMEIEKASDSLIYLLLENYYIPFFLKPALKIEASYDKYRVDKVLVQITFNGDNTPREVVLKSGELRFKMRYKENLKKEIQSWYFPGSIKDVIEYRLEL